MRNVWIQKAKEYSLPHHLKMGGVQLSPPEQFFDGGKNTMNRVKVLQYRGRFTWRLSSGESMFWLKATGPLLSSFSCFSAALSVLGLAWQNHVNKWGAVHPRLNRVQWPEFVWAFLSSVSDMGKDDLIEAARLGNYPTCEKILSCKPKKPGPFAR